MRLVLHGFTETDQLWAEAFAPLGPGTRCVLLPGHGWTPCPAGTTLASAAAALPLRGGDLIGYSMGGRLALQAALDSPTRVRRLVLVSCHAGLRSERERELRRRHDAQAAAIIEEDGLGAFVAWWQANPALRPARPQPREEQQRLRGVRLGQDPRGLAAALRCLGAGAMDDLWPRLGALDLPVLLVAGAADAAYRERLAEMARLLPRARLEVVPDAGHAVHREQPAALAALVHRFLAG